MKRFVLFLVVTCFLLSSCEKHFCGEKIGLDGSALLIHLFNTAANDYFYPENGALSPYKKDSLQVINEDGRKFTSIEFLSGTDPRNNLRGYYSVKIAPAFIIPDDNSAYDTEKTRKIYLKYNHTTTDTLTLVFKAQRDKCDKGSYEYLKIYFRNNLLTTVSNTIYADFKVNH